MTQFLGSVGSFFPIVGLNLSCQGEGIDKAKDTYRNESNYMECMVVLLPIKDE